MATPPPATTNDALSGIFPGTEAPTAYGKSAGDEPLPGYRLIAPLGRGGFGEVWKCEAPGGLHKAIKFVAPDPALGGTAATHALRQEYEAFQQIKAIRHPFIIQLERVELQGGELIMVMELADAQLQDRRRECVEAGLPGIPRAELLGYFADAAEALDVIGAKHGLQHLDVKPANLFLIGGHVKVGDYGLVSRLEAGEASVTTRGLTPRYVAPELLDGHIDPRSDQYSLALVYQELLTGTYPYAGKTAPQLMFQHITGTPDLSGLPECDRGPVRRALAKNPTDRFPSCVEFVRALMLAAAPPDGATPADGALDLFRRTRVGGGTESAARVTEADTTTVPGRRSPTDRPVKVSVATTPMPPPSASVFLPPPNRIASAPGQVRLDRIYCVVSSDRLRGTTPESTSYVVDEFLDAVLAAAAGWAVPRESVTIVRLPDGTWGCRFPTNLLPAVAPLKLGPLIEDGWCNEITEPEPGVIVLRIRDGGRGRLWDSRPQGGAELEVRLPGRAKSVIPPIRPSAGLMGTPAPTTPGTGSIGEAEVFGRLYGDPDPKFTLRAETGIPRLIREVRRFLQTGDERRKDRRMPLDTAVTIYPITPEGLILPTIAGRGRNVSAGGIACSVPEVIPARYVYIEIADSGPATGLAILTRVLRCQQTGSEYQFAGRFRTEV
jgi:serine/threonine protein kinase